MRPDSYTKLYLRIFLNTWTCGYFFWQWPSEEVVCDQSVPSLFLFLSCDVGKSSRVFSQYLQRHLNIQYCSATVISMVEQPGPMSCLAVWWHISSFLLGRNTCSPPSRLATVNTAPRNHSSNTNKICHFKFFKAVCFVAIFGSSALCKIPCPFQIHLLHFFHPLALPFWLKLRLKIKIKAQQQCSVQAKVSQTNWQSREILRLSGPAFRAPKA